MAKASMKRPVKQARPQKAGLFDFMWPKTGDGGGSSTVGADAARHSAQSWVARQVRDIDRGIIKHGDGGLAAVVRVEPAAWALLSDRERDQRVSALHEAVTGIDGSYQIVALPRPLDLDSYITDLDRRLADADATRHHLLSQYTGYVRRLVSSGEAVERRYYVLLGLPAAEARRRGASIELEDRARELAAALTRAGLPAAVATQSDVIDMIYIYMHPSTAAWDRPEPAGILPVYRPAGPEQHDEEEGTPPWLR